MKINPGPYISFPFGDPEVRRSAAKAADLSAKKIAESAGGSAAAAIAVFSSEIVAPVIIGGVIIYGIYKLLSD